MLVSMKILLAAILVLAFCVESLDIDKDLLLSKPYSWFLEKITLEGEYLGFWTPSQIVNFHQKIAEKYPEIVLFQGSIGQSYNKTSIEALSISLVQKKETPDNFGSTSAEKQKVTKIEDIPSNVDNILFTGYILGTDMITLDMHVAYLVYLLQKYVEMDIEILSLFENRVLHFVPALNPDTIEFLNSYHLKTGHTKMLYKNRRADKITSLAECGESGIGVNLNRNFPIGFDFNPQRSQQACHPSYQGEKPFSEPESLALDIFARQIKPTLAINLFSVQNYLNFPDLQMKGDQETFQKRDFSGFLQVLKKDEFKYFENGLHLFDEAKDTIPVIAKGGGDLKSYFFYKLSTFSLDFFIGTNIKKDRQYMPRHEGLNNILQDNLVVLKYLSCKSGQQLTFELEYEVFADSRTEGFSFLKIKTNYYGVKFKVQDSGANGVPKNSAVCIAYSINKGFFLDTVYDVKSNLVNLGEKKSFRRNCQDRSQLKSGILQDCFSVSVERFSYANFYFVFRKSGKETTDRSRLADSSLEEPNVEKLLPSNYDIAIYPKTGLRCCDSLLRGKLNFPEQISKQKKQ